MPVSPHPIEITVYALDGSTLLAGAKCILRNVTKRSSTAVATTDDVGTATMDLANLPVASGETLEYETGDKILIISYDKRIHAHVAAIYTVAGSSKSQSLYMTHVNYDCDQTPANRVSSIVVANSDASNNYYCKLWSFDDGQLVGWFQVLKDDTIAHTYGLRGIPGKFVVETENTAVKVTLSYK